MLAVIKRIALLRREGNVSGGVGVYCYYVLLRNGFRRVTGVIYAGASFSYLALLSCVRPELVNPAPAIATYRHVGEIIHHSPNPQASPEKILDLRAGRILRRRSQNFLVRMGIEATPYGLVQIVERMSLSVSEESPVAYTQMQKPHPVHPGLSIGQIRCQLVMSLSFTLVLLIRHHRGCGSAPAKKKEKENNRDRQHAACTISFSNAFLITHDSASVGLRVKGQHESYRSMLFKTQNNKKKTKYQEFFCVNSKDRPEKSCEHLPDS